MSGFEADDEPPNVSHEPSASAPAWRSITRDVASTPEPLSVLSSTMSPTEAAPYQGPVASDADCPVGTTRSIVTLLTSVASISSGR